MTELWNLTWTDCKEYFQDNDTVIIPVGSTEQHGPHNPLITDYLCAYEIAKAVGERTGVLVLPGMPVGLSVHHRQFTGTLWISDETFHCYLRDIIGAAAYHGAAKFVVINGHGGNSAALFRLAHELRMDHDLFVAIAGLDVVPGGWPQVTGDVDVGAHGGIMETSINLHFRPDLVRMDRIAGNNWQQEELGDLPLAGYKRLPFAVYGQDTIDLTDTGIMGARSGVHTTAEGASAELAKEFLDRYIEGLSEFVYQLNEADVSGLLCKGDK